MKSGLSINPAHAMIKKIAMNDLFFYLKESVFQGGK